MICESCEAGISEQYRFAIKNNQCPACGEAIMCKEKVKVYAELCKELKANFKNLNTNVENIAILIINKFDIGVLPATKNISAREVKTPLNQELNVEEGEGDPLGEIGSEAGEIDPEELEEAKMYFQSSGTLEENREILRKMREDALSGALADFDPGFDQGPKKLFSDIEGGRERALSGRGSFTRCTR